MKHTSIHSNYVITIVPVAHFRHSPQTKEKEKKRKNKNPHSQQHEQNKHRLF